MIVELLLLLNTYRTSPLVETHILDIVAEQRCAQQVAQGFISHDGLPSGLGENLAAGFPTASSVMEAWAGSPGHAANMAAPQYQEVGLAVCYGAPYGTYWVQVFGLGNRLSFKQAWFPSVGVA